MLIRKEAEQGFTLIEAMVTMLIVSVGLLAMANLLITAIRVNHTNETRIEASSLAQSTMAYYINEVRAQGAGYTQPPVVGGVSSPRPPTLMSATKFKPLITFPPTVACAFTDITVKLSWVMYGQTKFVTIHSGAMTEKAGGCP